MCLYTNYFHFYGQQFVIMYVVVWAWVAQLIVVGLWNAVTYTNYPANGNKHLER